MGDRLPVRSTVNNCTKSVPQMRKCLGLHVTDLPESEAQTLGNISEREPAAVGSVESESQPQHRGPHRGEVSQQGVGRSKADVGRAFDRPGLRRHGTRDPLPRVGGQPGSSIGIKPVDGLDQALDTRGDGLLQRLASKAQTQAVEDHEAQTGADQLLARIEVTGAGGRGQQPFGVGGQGGLGQGAMQEG